MGRPKSTTQQGREHEEAMVSLFEFVNARRSRSSGANPADDTDVVSDLFSMECESTLNESYSLKKSFWKEIKSKMRAGRIPMLGIQFLDVDPRRTVNLVVMSADDVAELLEHQTRLDKNGKV